MSIKPTPEQLAAWRAAAGHKALDQWIMDALNRASNYNQSNLGITGLSEGLRAGRPVFRLNWSEGGVKKCTTISFTPKNRAEKLLEASALLLIKKTTSK